MTPVIINPGAPGPAQLLEKEAGWGFRVKLDPAYVNPFAPKLGKDVPAELVVPEPAYPAGRKPQPDNADREIGLGPAEPHLEVAGISEGPGLKRGKENHGLAEGDNVRHGRIDNTPTRRGLSRPEADRWINFLSDPHICASIGRKAEPGGFLMVVAVMISTPVCPLCGGPRSFIVAEFAVGPGRVVRRRQCAACRRQFEAREAIPPAADALAS
jgi:hypothetical protein